jgi:Putative GTPases (G3E family)
LDEVEEKIRGVRDGARIARTTRCLVSLPLILGVGLFQSDQDLFDRPDHFHVTADRFDAVSFEADQPIDVDKFQHFLEHISNNVFRAKGLLWIMRATGGTSFISWVGGSSWMRPRRSRRGAIDWF